MLKFLVPPGIGDFSAMYAKLCGLDREITIIPTSDGPHRLMPFLEILPKVKHEDYRDFSTNFCLQYTLQPGTDLCSLEDGEYFLSINEWLETGHSVEDWIPGPKADYHYRMDIKQGLKDETSMFMDELPQDHGVLIGVYCTSYSNSRHWGFWGPVQWFDFLLRIRSMIPAEMNPVFIFIGAEYDLGISDTVSKMMLDHNADLGSVYFQQAYTLGRFHIGSTIELIKRLDYFFIFPSGLGFLADVVSTPHVMWFPPNLDKMRYTFSDPANNFSRTLHLPFTDPEKAAEMFSESGLKTMEGSYVRRR